MDSEDKNKVSKEVQTEVMKEVIDQKVERSVIVKQNVEIMKS